MKRRLAMVTMGSATLCTSVMAKPSREELIKQVTSAELAFAKTMIDRDHVAFQTYLADDAVFLNGGKPLRGKTAIAEYWKSFYKDVNPPFSWKPDLVEVLDTGRLAQSIGPVTAPNGKVIARFYSTWRLEPGGTWRIVFDDGYDVCNCPSK